MKKILLSLLLIGLITSCNKNCKFKQSNLAVDDDQHNHKDRDDSSNIKTANFIHRHQDDVIGIVIKFTFSLKYAARDSLPLESSQGKIYWNNVLIANLAPNDYNIHTFTHTVNVKVGTNTLRIQGAGTSDCQGLTIDNVQLIRVGTNNNIVVNGGFERPPQNGKWHIYAGIDGWTCDQIEVGDGKIYNSRWTSQICEIDGSHNNKISQKFTFDNNYKLLNSGSKQQQRSEQRSRSEEKEDRDGRDNEDNSKDDSHHHHHHDNDKKLSKTFTLSLQYAARHDVPYVSNQGKVYWNNVLIAELTPNDINIHKLTQNVTVIVGTNTLRIQGSGTSDSYGLGIDNVQFIRVGTTKNIVVNRDFEKPNQNGVWATYPGVQGWSSSEMQIGYGKIYNGKWYTQICELDGNHNDAIIQSFTFNKNYKQI